MAVEFFILCGKFAVPAEDTQAWGKWLENAREERQVAKTFIRKKLPGLPEIMVSTVFLGLDHSFGAGPPQIFETMIFGGQFDQHGWRDSTWWGAEARHAAVVRMVKRREGIK